MPNARCDLLLHRAGDVWVVIDPVDDAVHSLNASAYWVLHHCDGRTAPSVIAEALASMSGIGKQQAEADVDSAIDQFRGMKLLTGV